ncbi:MAG: T9SS type A sorting domain-containing protein [Chitinophagia bacterium]
MVFPILLIKMEASMPPNAGSSSGSFDNKIIQIYPNPASTVINFTFQGNNGKQHILQIYSFIGKKMMESRVQDTKLTVQLDENYYRGIYIYQLRDLAGRLIDSGKFQVIK